MEHISKNIMLTERIQMENTHTHTHTVWFCLCEMSRKGKSLETENRLVVAWGWR